MNLPDFIACKSFAILSDPAADRNAVPASEAFEVDQPVLGKG
jgi:hypothetical protein